MRRWWLVCIALLVLGIAWWSAVWIQSAEVTLSTLPTLVTRQLQAHRDPLVPLSAISPWLPEASVAIEDRSFWRNWGVSLEGIARAALVDVASEAFVQGGSTITQQLIRDQLLTFRKSLRRKAREVAYALLLTRRMSKKEILTLYLNEVNYGNGNFGVYAASEGYFGTPPADLNLAQSALLAGLPQNPSGLDPYRHPRAALGRRALVLDAMRSVGDISPKQALRAGRAPLNLLPAP